MHSTLVRFYIFRLQMRDEMVNKLTDIKMVRLKVQIQRKLSEEIVTVCLVCEVQKTLFCLQFTFLTQFYW